MRLTRSGLGVLVGSILLAALGVRWRYVELMAVGAVGVVAVAVAWLVVQRPHGLVVVGRSAPVRAARLAPVPCRLRVGNVGVRTVPAVFVVDSLLADDVSIAVVGLGPGEQQVHDYELRSVRRGLHDLGPLQARRQDLLGLVSHERALGAQGSIIIHPIVYDLTGAGGADRPNELEQIIRRATPDPLAGFQSLREYVPGDDTRTIHWATTAKTGRYMVREFVDARRPLFTLVVDTSASAHTPGGFEEAIDVAASLALHALKGELDVVVRTTDARFPGVAEPVREGVQVLDLLARVEPTSGTETVPLAQLLSVQSLDEAAVVVSGPTGKLTASPLLAERLTVIRIGGAHARVAGEFSAPDAVAFRRSWVFGS